MEREEIQAMVRETLKAQIAGDDQVNEGFGSVALFAALATAGWAWVRSTVRKAEQNELLTAFIEKHDKNKVISKGLADLVRRFKLVNSVTDLDTLEKKVDQYLKELEAMGRNVDGFVDNAYREEKSFGDKALARNPQKEKQKIKDFISSVINNISNSFSAEIEAKKNELLG